MSETVEIVIDTKAELERIVEACKTADTTVVEAAIGEAMLKRMLKKAENKIILEDEEYKTLKNDRTREAYLQTKTEELVTAVEAAADHKQYKLVERDNLHLEYQMTMAFIHMQIKGL